MEQIMEQKLIKTNDTNINCDINLLNCKEIFNFLIRSKITSINNDAAKNQKHPDFDIL